MAVRSSRLTVAGAFVACAGASPLIATAQEPVRIPPILVIGVAPLPGLGTPVEQVPSNVQTFGASRVKQSLAVPAVLYARRSARSR